MHKSVVLTVSRRGRWVHWSWSYRHLHELPILGFWGPNLCPVKEQYVLPITQPCLQPPPSGLFYMSYAHRVGGAPREKGGFSGKKETHPPTPMCKPSRSNKGNSKTSSHSREFTQLVSKFGSRSPATILTAPGFLTVPNS